MKQYIAIKLPVDSDMSRSAKFFDESRDMHDFINDRAKAGQTYIAAEPMLNWLYKLDRWICSKLDAKS